MTLSALLKPRMRPPPLNLNNLRKSYTLQAVHQAQRIDRATPSVRSLRTRSHIDISKGVQRGDSEEHRTTAIAVGRKTAK